MSLSRPDSPPPRQPTPELKPVPLPVARRVASQPKIRIQQSSSSLLLSPRNPKCLQSPRSHDALLNRHARTPSVGAPRPSTSTSVYNRTYRPVSSLDDDCQSTSSVPSPFDRRRARSTFGSTHTSSPCTSPAASIRSRNSGDVPSSPDNSAHFVPHHRRTLSVAYSTYKSAGSMRSRASPSMSPSPAPPVPLPPSPSGSGNSELTPAGYRYTGPQPIIPFPIACPKPISAPINIAQLQAHSGTYAARSVSSQTPPVPFPQIHHQQQTYLYPPVSQLHHSTNSSINSAFSMGSSSKQAHLEVPVTVTVPPLERHKGMGMSCLKFFGLRRSHRVSTTSVM